MSLIGKFIDERFLAHRRNSTSLAGISGGVFALLLFAWRYYVDHVWSWDLLSVGLVIVIVGVKMTLMARYLFNE